MTATHSPWSPPRWLALQKTLHKAPTTFPAQARPKVRGTQVTFAHARSLPGSVHLEPTHPSLFRPPSLQDRALFAGQPDLSYTFDLVPALCLHLASLVHGPVPCSTGKQRPFCPKETRSQNVTQIYLQMTSRPTNRCIQKPTWRQTHTELQTCRDLPDAHRNTYVLTRTQTHTQPHA